MILGQMCSIRHNISYCNLYVSPARKFIPLWFCFVFVCIACRAVWRYGFISEFWVKCSHTTQEVRSFENNCQFIQKTWPCGTILLEHLFAVETYRITYVPLQLYGLGPRNISVPKLLRCKSPYRHERA